MSLHPTSARWNEYSARRWASSIRPASTTWGDVHLETKPKAIDGAVHLENGETIKADLVVVGIGVRPRLGLAENAGLKLDGGVAVDPYLETARQTSLLPATLLDGPTLIQEKTSELSTGSWPSAKAKRRQ